MREQFERNARLFLPLPRGARFEEATVPAPGGRQMPALWGWTKGDGGPGAGAAGRTILYLHGGAYLAGSRSTHRSIVAALAGAAGARGLVFDYRLAPEHPLPAALDDALAAWRWLMARGLAPGSVGLAGESAGGGLAFALLAELTRLGEPLPGAVVAFSPWCDLTGSGPSVRENAERDAMLPAERLGEVVALCIGDGDPRDPRISPLFARFDRPPPALLFAGEDEILRDDATRMAGRLRDAGGEAVMVIEPRVPHSWPLFRGLLAEADRAIERAGMFLRERLCAG